MYSISQFFISVFAHLQAVVFNSRLLYVSHMKLQDNTHSKRHKFANYCKGNQQKY